MEVEVCYAEIGRALRIDVTLSPEATVAEALQRSGIEALMSRDMRDFDVAVFGRRTTLATVLVDGDRVELLRPLIVDPKEARRRRSAKKQVQQRAARVTPADQSVTCSSAPPAPAAC